VPFRETIIPPPKTDMVNEMLEGQTTTVKAQHVMSDEDGSEDSAQQDFIELQTTDRFVDNLILSECFERLASTACNRVAFGFISASVVFDTFVPDQAQ